MVVTRRRRRAWGAAGAAILLTLVTAAFLASACHYSDVLRHDALSVEYNPPSYGIVVVSGGDGTITLDPGAKGPSGDCQQDGIIGLEWPGGYGKLGAILAKDTGTQVVERKFALVSGEITAGTLANTDGFAFPTDPLVGRDLEFGTATRTGIRAWFPAFSKSWRDAGRLGPRSGGRARAAARGRVRARGEIGQVNRLSAAAPQEPGTLSNTPAIWKP